MPEKQTLVEVKDLSKKFCRRLKRSLWYGLRDIGAELVGSKREHVKLRKEEFWALKDIDFDIKQGELVGLIGANGAGKTTLLRVLSGLIKPDGGEITVRGKIQALIALGAGFNPILTARENIYINGAVLGFSKKEMDRLIEEIMDFAEIGEFIDMPVQSYSSGMQVRLGFAVAVNLKPDILIVDEVLAVGDASFRRKARNKMMELLHSGISVLFVSHNMALISSLTSRCLYLEKGRLKAVGPSDEVTALYLSDSIKKSKAKTTTAQPSASQKPQGARDAKENPLMDSAYFTIPETFVLRNVHVCNASGAKTAQFNTYDDIKIEFEIDFPKKIENVTLAVNISDQLDDVVISSSKMHMNTGPCEGFAAVRCEIKQNKFREGNYNVGFFVSDYYGGALFKSSAVSSFTILADSTLLKESDSILGFFVMDTSWKVL